MPKPDPFEKVTFRGRLMDRKTQAFLEAMEARLGYNLTIVQGCYSAGAVAASGGTHDGGGVVDLAAWDGPRKVRVARELGAFAWFRKDLPGVWSEHVHLGIRDHGRLSTAAQAQQRAYDDEPPRDGLASNAVDSSWHPDPLVTFEFPVKVEPPKQTNTSRGRDALVEAQHALGDAVVHLGRAGETRDAVKAVLKRVREQRSEIDELLDRLPKR